MGKPQNFIDANSDAAGYQILEDNHLKQLQSIPLELGGFTKLPTAAFSEFGSKQLVIAGCMVHPISPTIPNEKGCICQRKGVVGMTLVATRVRVRVLIGHFED